MFHSKRSVGRCLVLASFCLVLSAWRADAGTGYSFPKDSPDFTFELPDSMQAAFQADGTLVCTAKDTSLRIRGVFQPLPNIHSQKELLIGLPRLIRLIAPKWITSGLSYPGLDTMAMASGVPAVTVSAFGNVNGQSYAIAFICFAKGDHYYELTVSGNTQTMTDLSFPHSFRESMKLAP
jgi:hypothetical protein